MSNSANIPALGNQITKDVPNLNTLLRQMIQAELANVTDLPTRAKQLVEGAGGWEVQQFNGSAWVRLEDWNINAQKVDGFSASQFATANTVAVRDMDGALPGNLTGNAATATKAAALSAVNPIAMGGTGANTAEGARGNLGISDLLEAVNDRVDTTNSNLAATNSDLAAALSAQATKDAEQDAAISTKISSVNGLTPDSDGNVDVGGMPLGTLFPYTGHDVPPGTLRADGSTYTNMRASFPDFYDWVVASGLTVPLAEYTLVEGSCGFYGVNESTGTVRVPTLAAGVFGASVAGQYGMAVEAGLPGHTHTRGTMNITGNISSTVREGAFRMSPDGMSVSGAFSATLASESHAGWQSYSGQHMTSLNLDASRSWTGETSQPTNPIYGKSDTVTPSHVKYPWVIVVYNAAVSASVAQAQEFIGLLDGKADKAQVDADLEEGLAGVVRSVNGVAPDAAGNVALGNSVYLTASWSSGASWYRKWSDGWIEQGGLAEGHTNEATLSFFTNFSSTNYHINMTLLQTGVRRWPFVHTRSTTGCTYIVNDYVGTGSATNIVWYACGY